MSNEITPVTSSVPETAPRSFFKKGKKNTNKLKSETTAAIVFLLPAVLGLLIFMIIPMLYALWVSLHEWNGLTDMAWVGIDNYLRLLDDKEWFGSLGRTFLYTLLFVPPLFFASLTLALIVKNLPFLNGTFRTLFFLPVVMSSVISGLIWKLIYDEKFGMLNQILGKFGVEPISWLSSQDWALVAVAIVSVWLHTGFYMIIFLAGLQDIPRDIYEAAIIDGANRWQSFWHITLPNLRHTSTFVLIISVIGSFQVFDLIKLMTNGGPAKASMLSVQHIYETSFVLYDMGYASALSLCLFTIIMIFTILQMKLLKINKE